MKNFSEQLRACKASGYTGKGKKFLFKNHPDMLPAPWHPASKKIAKQLQIDPNFGLESIACLRFGGQCNSANPQCRVMRGLKPVNHKLPEWAEKA